MNKKTREFVDEYLRRSDRINRAIEGEVSAITGRMQNFNKDITKIIERKYPNLNERSALQIERILNKEVSEFYDEVTKNLYEESLGSLVQKEVHWNTAQMAAITSEKTISLPENFIERIKKRIEKKTYQGHTFDFWFKSAGEQNKKRIMALLQEGFREGKTTAEIFNLVNPLANKTASDTRTLVRSYLQRAAAETRKESLKSSQDLLDGYIWLSTLDNRTTPHICGVRDQKFYDLDFNPVDHIYPWDGGPGDIHFNCRSTFIPRVKKEYGFDYSNFGIERASVDAGDNYERGDKFNQAGRVRRVTRTTRERGIFEINMNSPKINYEQWLRTQPLSFLADSLGNMDYARKFKFGEINLAQYTNLLRPLTINNL